jgi:uncharacterized protein (TIGR03083 family)
MANESPWPTIHAERKALAADLGGLTDAQWATASLCPGWTVREVLAHMTSTAAMTPPKFMGRFIASGFQFEKLQAKSLAEQNGGSGADVLQRFSALVDATTHPPGPVDTWLGETIVHAEDIRRPLGIKHEYPLDGVTRAAEFFRKSNLLIGGKKRAAGLTLKATDTDWSAGEGPEVSGPALSIVLAITGRAAAVDDLSGAGVETLRSRI